MYGFYGYKDGNIRIRNPYIRIILTFVTTTLILEHPTKLMPHPNQQQRTPPPTNASQFDIRASPRLRGGDGMGPTKIIFS